jgi:putative membrane protein
MTQHYQRGDAGVVMLVMMAVLMIGFFWHGGAGHGGDRGHMSSGAPTGTAEKSPLDLQDEAHARGEVSREEYLQKREDLWKR